MFSIKSYDDILSINRDLAKLFCCPEDAVSLIVTINGVVGEWIEKHNKQYWEVVRFVCERRGLLGKKTKSKQNKLTRKDFAEILVTYCDKFKERGETWSALKASMEKYSFCNELARFDKLPDAHLARKDVQDVENLLDQQPVEVSPVKAAPTLKDIMYKYLKDVETIQAGDYPKIVVRQYPNYNKIRPAISVETFMSENMYNDGTPSHIDAYEVVDGTLTMRELNELTGAYGLYRDRVKLFIVSDAGMLPEVKSSAMERNVGYVRLNPYRPMTSDAYKLPRKVNTLELWRQHDDRLMLKDNMDIPLLIMDGARRETSFSSLYEIFGVEWNKTQLINVPFIQKKDIAKKAGLLTDLYEANLRSYNLSEGNQQMAINPFDVADEIGLTYEWKAMHDDILGMFDVRTGHVTLNIKYWQQSRRMRFTMAHEIGHYLLHANCFRESNITSLDETEETLKDGIWMNGEAIKRADYQANLFASYLLMPTLTTATLYAYYDEKFTDCKPDLMYYNTFQPETWPRYNFVVGHIAQQLQVSMEVATYRLIGMNFIKKS